MLEVPAAIVQARANRACARALLRTRSSGHGFAASQPTTRHALAREDVRERPHAVHVAAERARSRRGACVNSIGATIAGVGTQPKAFVRHARHVDHHRDPAARPDVDRRAAAGHAGRAASLIERVSAHRVLGDAGAQAAAGAAQEEHRAQRRLAVLADALDDLAHRAPASRPAPCAAASSSTK